MKKMQHCYYCGEELGIYDKPPHEHDTCGKTECERETRADERAERDRAHEELDEQLGYGRY